MKVRLFSHSSNSQLRWALLLIVVCAAGIRITAVCRTISEPLQYHGGGEDARQYYEIGESLSTTGLFRDQGHLTAFRGFLYPNFISLIPWRGRYGAGAVRFVQALLGTLLVFFVYALTEGLAGPFFGLVAAAIYAVEKIDIVLSLQIDILYQTLIVMIALRLMEWSRRPTARETALLGLSIGLSLACRSPLFLLPLFLIGMMTRWMPKWRDHAILLCACSYGPMIPWLIRNAVVFRRLIPFEDGASYINLYYASLGNVMVQRVTPRPGDPLILRAAISNIEARPLMYLLGCLRRLAMEFRIFGFTGIGLLLLPFLFRKLVRKRQFAVLGLFLGYYLGIHAFITLSDRYAFAVAPIAVSLVVAATAAFFDTRDHGDDRALARADWARSLISSTLFLMSGIYCVGAFRLVCETLGFNR